MFRDESEKQLKYAIRKKKTGGGAASFVIGSVIFGGMMLGTMTANADTVATNDTSNDAVTNQTGTDSTADATTTLKATTTPVATASSEGNLENTAAVATNENTTSTKPVNTATTSEATSKVETASSTSEVASSQADSTSTASEEASSAVANTNDKLQTSETSTPQASGTDLTRRAIAAENTNINVNNKVNITNVTFNKDEVVESEGTDINISFDWEAQGLHKGDTMVVPMFEGFDSVAKEVKYNFSSDSLSNMGTLVLNYNEHKIYVEYTGDIDPNKIYRGTMNIGTFVSRNYFENEKNEAQINIPLPDGTSISKTLKVNFDQAKEWDDAYAAAINETLSEDKTRADVSWVVEVNPKKKAMKSTAVYITPDNIDDVEVDDKSQSASIYYTSAQNPYTLDPDSIMVYEANITPSLGYTKGKKLVLGTDYEILRGAYDANTGSWKDNVWIVRFKGKYDVINGDQFVIEYNTHYDNLDPTLKSTTGDRAVAIGTDVNVNNVVTYFKPDLNLGGGIIYANVKLIDSSITSVEGENITGSVIVAHINGKTGEYLKPEAYVINGDTTLKDVKQGTPYTTSPENFDGFTFTRMGYDSAPATGTVNNSVQRVVYVYMPDELKGSVDVKYVTDKGEVLEAVAPAKTADGQDATNVKVGTGYNTVEKTFEGYSFKGMDKSSDPATGVVAEGTKHVIYVYTKNEVPEVKKGNVDVTYVTEDGKTLKATELVFKDAQAVGTDYKTEQKEFTGYHSVRMGEFSAARDGEVTENLQHVVYVYAADPVEKKGSVDVKYVTDKGEVLEAVAPAKTADGQDATNVKVGTGYNTVEKTFEGYAFKGMDKSSDPATGVVAEGTKHVIYVYTKNEVPEVKKGNVDVTYVTEDGKTLKATELVFKDAQAVGTDYKTEQKEFTGYHYVRMGEFSAARDGEVTENLQHVVYVYAADPVEKKGSVDVKYVTDKGEVLEAVAPAKTVDGQDATNVKVGTGYNTEEKTFEGYSFKGMDKSSDPATGVVAEGTKHVIYVYTKDEVPEVKKGNVDVTYVTEDGKTLKDTELVFKDAQEVGTDYTTEQTEFTGYHFVRMGEFSADRNGKVTENLQHVVYVYAADPVKKKGSVDVKYVTDKGEVLEAVAPAKTADGQDATNVKVGTDYTTKQKEFTGYHFVRMGEFSAARDGKVTENLQHVVYVYAADPVEKKGSVDVKYVTDKGEVLEAVAPAKTADGQDATNVKVGTGYNTEEKTFEGYSFKGMDKSSDPATGVVAEGTKHVIYVYTKDEVPEVKKGNVDVTYVTEDGKTLKDTELVFKDAQAVGTDYKTEQKGFTGYHFVRMGQFSAARDGKVTENLQHVVYVYAADPVEKKGSVDVKYVTDKGEVLEAVAPAKTADGQDATNVKVGTGYNTVEKTFEGYAFKGMDKSSDPATGVVAEGTKHVIYVYTKNEVPEVKKGNVDVTYVTEDGKTLKATELVFKDAQAVGSDYKTEQKEFTGYHFVRMGEFSATRDGKVTENLQHVVYVYAADPVEKKGSVDVKYMTDKGEVLEAVAPAKTADGQDATNVKVGTDYTTEEKSFDGYHFVGMDKTSDSANGKVTEGTKHVIYVYEKDPETPAEVEKKGSVTVTYVDKDGNPLPGGEETTVKHDVPVGEDYTTEEKDFPGYHFVGMDKTSDPANGKVTEGTKHVVYVYEKNPTPTVATDKEEEQKGSVTVTYVDKDGNPLPGGEETTVKHDVPVGEDYTTEEKDFPGYHFVGMDKTSDPANGKVTEGTKHVIYVYEKDPTPTVATDKSEEKKGSVDVKYVDTEGNVLEGPNSVVKDGLVGSDYNTSGKTFAGYKLIGMELGSASANGKVVEGMLHVIYLYQKVTADVPTAPTATSETPTVNKVQPSVTASVTPSAAQPKSEKQASTQVALPQTGETKQNSSMLGVIALGLAGMLGLGFKKEEKEDK